MQAAQLGSAFIAKNWLQISWIIFWDWKNVQNKMETNLSLETKLGQGEKMVKTGVKYLKQWDIDKVWVQTVKNI